MGRFSTWPITKVGLIPLVAIGVLAIVLYGFLIEPCQLTINTVPVHQGALAKTMAGRKAVLLSDLHFDEREQEYGRKILRLLKTIRPDIIFLTGDYVKWCSRAEAYENAITFLSQLSAPLGVYAVMGDADTTYSRKSCEFCHEPESGALTRRHEVTFFKNSRQLIRTGQGEFLLGGVDAEPDYTNTLLLDKIIDTDLPMILLAHSSLAYQTIGKEHEILVLSGDTHGGQVRLPRWFWLLTGRKPDPDHIYGFYQDNKKSLFVTRGVGTSWPPLRLGEPPEIVVLEFGDQEIL